MEGSRTTEAVFSGYIIVDSEIELPDEIENVEPQLAYRSQIEFCSKEELIKFENLLKGIEVIRIDVFVKLSHDDAVNFFVLVDWLKRTGIKPYVVNLPGDVSFNGGCCDDKEGVLLMFELKSLSEIQYMLLLQELPDDTEIKNMDGYNLQILL